MSRAWSELSIVNFTRLRAAPYTLSSTPWWLGFKPQTVIDLISSEWFTYAEADYVDDWRDFDERKKVVLKFVSIKLYILTHQ